ncbi:hypothetical protein HNR20_005229 [Micromonospora parathelypteridis]|uniref:Uncharacterized protein n=1 Tax=Micromonospora parathelypteridis TaxID=1839617 RepID=A0A840W3V5_9ACTN|nr:hypothetical protein [Micromonospora parathelypteridis]
MSADIFPEEKWVTVSVCEYAGSNLYNCNNGNPWYA